jgi:hypothetical protein
MQNCVANSINLRLARGPEDRCKFVSPDPGFCRGVVDGLVESPRDLLKQ